MYAHNTYQRLNKLTHRELWELVRSPHINIPKLFHLLHEPVRTDDILKVVNKNNALVIETIMEKYILEYDYEGIKYRKCTELIDTINVVSTDEVSMVDMDDKCIQ